LITVLAAHMLVFFPALATYSSWLALDQFFVLSGFLITTLLLREFGKSGRVSLRLLYVRRIARLCPMIFAAFLTAIFLRLFVPIRGMQPSWLGVASIGAYFSNWAVIFTNDWQVLGAFSQLWSLAVEEQFYILWPPVLFLILLVGGRRRTIIAVAGTALAAMLLYRRHLWIGWIDMVAADPRSESVRAYGTKVWTFLYVGTFTRPDGLLIGCLLAAVIGFRPTRPGPKIRMLVAVSGTAGFVLDVVLFIIVPVDGRLPFTFNWGLFAFNVGAAATLLHLLYSPNGPLGRFYGFRPLVWLGQRSYGIYVIHLVVYFSFLHNGWRAAWLAVVANVIVLGVAAASYRWYEMPLRRYVTDRFGHEDRRPRQVEPSVDSV
ncbi:MAG: acyltransferase, partial [Actinobacteria bacterium]|nr:acyltransferase [Actinomycetota bacterium]